MALAETNHPGEHVLSEGNGYISRDEVIIAAAAGALPAGQVLGKITASGKYVAYSNAAADGTEVAAAVLYAAVPDSAADQPATVHNYHCEVIETKLTGLDATGKTDLIALKIKFR